MRKFIVFLLLLAGSLGLRAAQSDAFKGIYPPTDKKVMKSLNGTWHLKVINGVNRDPRVPERDATWGTIPVPGCWEQYGFSKASYYSPDSLTGYYRTSFTVPTAWKGQRVCIRLDGVLRGYDLWLNGRQVGTWEMPYNTCLFDLTPYLTKKAFKGEEQQLALHVVLRQSLRPGPRHHLPPQELSLGADMESGQREPVPQDHGAIRVEKKCKTSDRSRS